jgi:hypothetical protein
MYLIIIVIVVAFGYHLIGGVKDTQSKKLRKLKKVLKDKIAAEDNSSND